MFKNLQKTKLSYRLLIGGALLAAGMSMYSCKDKYDLDSDDNQPEGLTSIYDYLQTQGTYNNYLRLIDDLGQTQILKTTGSKTLFVADDAAFSKFFQNNSWGVRSYGQLSKAQKKLLLNGSMLDNPYTTDMLSSAAAVSVDNPTPVRGEVFRRPSSMSIMDSVLIMSTKNDKHIPTNSFTARFKQNNDSMVVFNDHSTTPPIIHFTRAYLTANKLESSDIDFIYNKPAGTRQPDDVNVNEAKILEANIYCKNGFVHKVDRVITPLPNMADIIRDKSQFSYFNSILERFQSFRSPVGLAEKYNTQYGTNHNAAYSLGYFSDRSYGSTATSSSPFSTDYYSQICGGSLKYDPAWNGYVPLITNPRDPMMEDMGVMIVPDNVALSQWWLDGGGTDIKNQYAPHENDVIKGLQMTPISTLQELVNVNMLPSFNASVPSRFPGILNDANEPLGITTESIDSVFLGCNGAVYQSHQVFTPSSYRSVLFPVVIDTTSFKVIMNAIKVLDYDKYLNSMASRYSFFVPKAKDGALTYVDPVSYGATTTNIWKFKYDEASGKIYADVYDATLQPDGTWKEIDGGTVRQVGIKNKLALGPYSGVSNPKGDEKLADRLEELLDNIIVLGELESGKKYYRTKGNKYIYVDGFNGNYSDAKSLSISGAGQTEWKSHLNAEQSYKKDNGHTYIMDGTILGGTKTVYGALSEYSKDNGGEFSKFLEILSLSDAVNSKNTKDSWVSATRDDNDGNLFNLKEWGDVGAEKKPGGVAGKYKAAYLLNNYHYTIYAPTNEAMEIAFAKGLPTPDSLRSVDQGTDFWEKEDSLITKAKVQEHHLVDSLREIYLDFIKYHIQDNAVFKEAASQGGLYETARVEFIPATTYNEKTNETEPTGKYTTGRPYKVEIQVSNGEMTVKEAHISAAPAKVVVPNLVATEYWIKGANAKTSPWSDGTIENSSFAVIHGIDRPLLFDEKAQFKYTYKELEGETSSAKPRK